MLATLAVVIFVGFGLFGGMMAANLSAVRARWARDERDAAALAAERLRAGPPAADGGSVAPDAPLPGWSDTVWIEGTETGDASQTAPPDGALLVLRQWAAATDADGVRGYAVSAVVLDPRTGGPRERGPVAVARYTVVN
jgi:hypothetical protein